MYRTNVDLTGRRPSRLKRLFGGIVGFFERSDPVVISRPLDRPRASARLINDALGKVVPEVADEPERRPYSGIPEATLTDDKRREAAEELRRRPRIG